MADALYVLDTCVWRDLAECRGSAWLRALRDRCGGRIAIADQAARELACNAATCSSPSRFQTWRRACVLVARYAECALPPIEWHLAAMVGFMAPGVIDPRELCRAVAAASSQAELRGQEIIVGPGHTAEVDRMAQEVQAEKQHWAQEFLDLAESAAPGSSRPHHDRPPVEMTPGQYARSRDELRAGARGLAQLEVHRMRHRFGLAADRLKDDEKALSLLQEALDTYAAVLGEALLDRVDGDHNRGKKKVKFKGNDWYDLAQLRYIQGESRWVTCDGVWHDLAERAGVRERVVSPEDLDLPVAYTGS